MTFLGMGQDDKGVMHCPQCGHYWQSRDIYLWWPVQLAIYRGSQRFFAHWGYEIGSDGPGVRFFGHTFQLGPIQFRFGRHGYGYYPRLRPVKWHGHWGWFYPKQAARLQQHLDDEAQIDQALRNAIKSEPTGESGCGQDAKGL